MNEDKNMIPVSFSDARIGREIENAHCLQASSLQKEGITQKQEMTRIVCPVLTPDRAEKRQNGRRFKDNGEPSFTLTAQDIHGVGIGVNIRGNEVQGAADEAHCLNANDQRKVFGANQERTLVGCLRSVRSEYGKAIRKDYEAGNIDISRHEFLEHEIRQDGITNTLDSVQKDNMVAMKVKEATKQGYSLAHKGDSINLSMPDSSTRRGRVGGGSGADIRHELQSGNNGSDKGEYP